jgi:hypothetical protein
LRRRKKKELTDSHAEIESLSAIEINFGDGESVNKLKR